MAPAAQKKNPPPIVFIATGLGLVMGCYALGIGKNPPITLMQNASVQDRMSLGEKILIGAQATKDKELGATAFAAGNYRGAIDHFRASLSRVPNDPESVMYLSNAEAANTNITAKTIAVSVPISSNLNVAQEILRGVAQVQQEVNRSGGINAQPLAVKIIDDQNDPAITQQVAQSLVSDPQILAVIGHNASDATLVAAPIYQQGKLVMISPTSMSSELSGLGSYIFRTVPNTRFLADPLAKYVVKTARKTRVAVCFDAQAKDNVSFKNEFIASLEGDKGRFIETGCNFASSTFNPETAVAQAIRQGADSILVTPHVDRLDRAINLVRAVKGRLVIFSSPTLYTQKTLQTGAQDVNGLVLPVPWHPSISATKPELNRAHQLWGGEINWRTAMALDAARAVVAGLQRSGGSSRESLQQILRAPEFRAKGMAEDIRFLPTGDRISTPVLAQVQPDPKSPTGYAFIPLK
jgi:branched-chain amino acid transport system substrate-binding protein